MPMCNSNPSNNASRPASLYTELEEKLMFQQRALDELNGVVLQQQAELVRLGREMHGLRTVVERLRESSHGEDLPHEKPPHY